MYNSKSFKCVSSPIDYYSGEGEGLRGCVANVPFRKSLMALVLQYLFIRLIQCLDCYMQVLSEESALVPEKDSSQLGDSLPHQPQPTLKTSELIGMRHAAMHMGKLAAIL